ncbi:MAG: TerD family protein [Oscillospiraceae bacterium]|nr:TerD family protein [Oscillospiraceae bacterium]
MAVNLQKGQKIDLTKTNAGLKMVTVGLGWDEAPKKFSLFGGGKSQDIDCDALAIALIDDKLKSNDDVVFYNNLNHKSHCILHQGDNLTGAGDGDDEQVKVYLSDLPAQYNRIVFAVTIYEAYKRNQNFGMIKNAFIRIVNAENNQELCRFNLSDNYDGMTAMVFGELYRHNGEWKFNAVGEGTKDDGVSQIVKRFI